VTLARLVTRFETIDRSTIVVDRTEPDPVYDMPADILGDDALHPPKPLSRGAPDHRNGVRSRLDGAPAAAAAGLPETRGAVEYINDSAEGSTRAFISPGR